MRRSPISETGGGLVDVTRRSEAVAESHPHHQGIDRRAFVPSADFTPHEGPVGAGGEILEGGVEDPAALADGHVDADVGTGKKFRPISYLLFSGVVVACPLSGKAPSSGKTRSGKERKLRALADGPRSGEYLARLGSGPVGLPPTALSRRRPL